MTIKRRIDSLERRFAGRPTPEDRRQHERMLRIVEDPARRRLVGEFYDLLWGAAEADADLSRLFFGFQWRELVGRLDAAAQEQAARLLDDLSKVEATA